METKKVLPKPKKVKKKSEEAKNQPKNRISGFQDLIKTIENLTYNQNSLQITPLPKKISSTLSEVVSFSRYSYSNLRSLSHNISEEQCPICMCEFSEIDSKKIVKPSQCEGHYFHEDCIKMCHSGAHLKCPICGIIYGTYTGDMTEGTMSVIKYPYSLAQIDGYPNTDVLEIVYRMKSGKRGSISFPGTTRVAYLPCNRDGTEILGLLIVAFQRRLTFTIGTSVTTGRDNQVVWNGIHHKTSLNGGTANFGYPDNTYFFRVKEELAAKGIY